MKTINISAIYWTKGIADRLADSYADEAYKIDELMNDEATARNEDLRRVLYVERSRIWANYRRVTADDLSEITENDVRRIEDALHREQTNARYDDVADMLKKMRFEFIKSAETALEAERGRAE